MDLNCTPLSLEISPNEYASPYGAPYRPSVPLTGTSLLVSLLVAVTGFKLHSSTCASHRSWTKVMFSNGIVPQMFAGKGSWDPYLEVWQVHASVIPESLFRKALDTFKFLRHVTRAFLSTRARCSHRCVSRKKTP